MDKKIIKVVIVDDHALFRMGIKSVFSRKHPDICVAGEAENGEEISAHKWEFKSTEGFYRFLKSNNNITPLSNQDLELVLHFIKTGPIAGKSRVYFDENSRIVVVEGPLCGLEGRIIKVDKRKRRAKISLDLYNDSFTIDLAFDIIGSI